MKNKKKERRLKLLKSIMKEGRDITTNFREIKRIMRGYYDQLYTKKLDNVDERDTFLEIKLL